MLPFQHGGHLLDNHASAAATLLSVNNIRWWLPPNIALENVIAVYQPIGADDLASSYINLVNPGTYDAAPGVAPTWNVDTGWTFSATQYLNTGIKVDTWNWTILVRFSGAVSANTYMFGVFTPGNSILIQPNRSANVYYAYGETLIKAPGMTEGVLGVAGPTMYRDGFAESGSLTPGVSLPDLTQFLGGLNNNGTPTPGWVGNIQAALYYNTILDASGVATMVARMATLPTESAEVITVPDDWSTIQTWYASPTGTYTGDGSIGDPLNWAGAIAAAGPGDTIMLRGGTYDTDVFGPTVNGTFNYPITVTPYQDENVVFDADLTFFGDHWIIDGKAWQIRFTWSSWTSRITAIAGSGGGDLGFYDVKAEGDTVGVRFVGCVFDNLSNITIYGSAASGRVAFEDCLMFNIGWLGPDRGHGHLYCKNADGANVKIYRNCIMANCFGGGVAMYADGADKTDYQTWYRICSFGSGRMPSGTGDDYNFFIGNYPNTYTLYNPTVDECVSWDGSVFRIGGADYGPVVNTTLTDNYIPESIVPYADVTFLANSGNIETPTDGTYVWASQHDATRGFVLISNSIAGAASVNVDVAAILSDGDSYEIRNAEDFYGEAAVTGTLSGTTTITFDMQLSSHTCATPTGSATVVDPHFPDFGAFVIWKTS